MQKQGSKSDKCRQVMKRKREDGDLALQRNRLDKVSQKIYGDPGRKILLYLRGCINLCNWNGGLVPAMLAMAHPADVN
jgi:hypothetical protein